MTWCAPALALLAALSGGEPVDPADPTPPCEPARVEHHEPAWRDVLDVPAPYEDWDGWLARPEPAQPLASDHRDPAAWLTDIAAQAAAERAEQAAAERAAASAAQHLSDDAGDTPDTAPYNVVRGQGDGSADLEALEDSGATSTWSVDWDALAKCESGGNWSIATGNGYYGGLQFSAESWRWVGGSGLPHEHSRDEQIARAEVLLGRQGLGAWPACTRKLGWR